ncbi:MAG: serine/threonine-protein phosphatase [Spirochaetes bacterium]|nr:serine/threonine-protein phosphatase [Spirochaetota bacterium]
MNHNFEEIYKRYQVLEMEAQEVREKDKIIIRNLFGNFYNKNLNIGLGFQRAYGSVLSGDYFELFELPGKMYLFVFADISGHGLPAYTTLVRLRSALNLSILDCRDRNPDRLSDKTGLISDIVKKFTDIMECSGANDFASIIFTFIENRDDKYYLTFYNRGMHFPFVVRKFNGEFKDLYDLNINEKGWEPIKGHLVGPEIRSLLAGRYENFPSCEFIIYEGDSILFFSDGIVEACVQNNGPSVEFGYERLKNSLIENIDLMPQAVINHIFEEVYLHIQNQSNQTDDMTAVLIDFPVVR